jgi:hypothetical protein
MTPESKGCIVQVHVQKIRFRQDGMNGVEELSYNWRLGTYHLSSKAVKEIPPQYG